MSARAKLGIVTDHCTPMVGRDELRDCIHQLLTDRNALIPVVPGLLTDSEHDALMEARAPGHYLIGGLPHEPGTVPRYWESMWLDFVLTDAALDDATRHLDVAHEFPNALNFTWSSRTAEPPSADRLH